MYISKQTSYDKRLADILIYLYLHSSECDLKVIVTVFLYISMLFEEFQKLAVAALKHCVNQTVPPFY